MTATPQAKQSGAQPVAHVGHLALALTLLVLPGAALAHGIGGADAAFVAASQGPQIVPFFYLGAKHMVTGYDHLLFILGIVFFLHRLRNVALCVSLFSLGHSITLLVGVLNGLQVNAFLVDAIIGLSVAYKGYDNLGGVKSLLGFQPNTRWVVFGFGLVHGFGLATKLQALHPGREGLITNLLSFNLGVEAGQLVALSVMLAVLTLWRRDRLFSRTAVVTNIAIIVAGFVLMDQQLLGYLLQQGV